METPMLDDLNRNLLQWLNIATRDQHHLLWKFYLYYFLMRNKQLKKNQIGEIEDFLSYYELPQDDWQYLDENIVTFLLGYRILQETRNEKKFKDKAKAIKKEMEKHWNNENKSYFENNLYTLLILLSGKENQHKEEILEKFKTTEDYALISIIFMILEQDTKDKELRRVYESIFKKLKEEYYKVRDAEKIYAAWLLWKYKGLLNSKIKEIREMVFSSLSMVNNRFAAELKEGTLNLETIFIYDLVHDFERGTRMAFEEVPFIFKLLGAFNGFIFFALISFIDFHLWKNGYLQHSELLSLNTVINTVIVLSSVLVVYLSGFLIYEVGFKGICANKEIKRKLREWLVQKYFWSFAVGVVILGFVTQLI